MEAFYVPPTPPRTAALPSRSVRTCRSDRRHELDFNLKGSNVHRSLLRNPPGTDHFLRTTASSRRRHSKTTSCLRANNSPAKVAVLVSGGGRSLENICERIEARILTGCELSVVIASKKTAGAIEKAERFGIPTRVLGLRDFERSTELFSDAISSVLDEYDVDLVVLAGWMHFYLIPSRYEGKVINIHPSLIPAFCGKGYFGHHVHQAVIDFGAKVSGCTVHLADNEYDHGPIILQKAVAVQEFDNADELAARVFECEREALPEAIQLFVDGKLSRDGRLIRVKSEPISNNI